MGYASVPDMTPEELDKAKKDLHIFLQKNLSMFYLFLNNESRYYTVFTYKENLAIKQMATTIMDIAINLGPIKSIEFHEDKVEFWIVNENECKVYYLFDYAEGVVQV